ncbi:MAG: protein kinase [Planctomycetota bacterium]|nr:protein kinase [Planctomycetota bacterium]
MDGNQKQGERILKYGFLPEAVVSKAWSHLQQDGSHIDLCELLHGRGLLTRDQADRVRRSLNSESDSTLPVIPGYSLGQELAQGGMGRVYLAQKLDSQQEVVVKLLLHRNGDFLRFQREARVLAQLSHSHIVKVLGFNQVDACPYIIMERIRGHDLKRSIDKQKKELGRLLDFREVLRILTHIADALTFCHSRKVVHRDIKPHNILIEEKTGRPVLIDFGLAFIQDEELKKRIDSDSKGLTQSGEVLGTPQFMAPEALGSTRGNASLDVWGLGATFYYALTGVPPYDGANSLNVFKSLTTRDPKVAAEVNPTIPGALSDLCMSCLARNPDERPSMAKLASELRTLDATYSSELNSGFRKKKVSIGKVILMGLVLTTVVIALFTWFSFRSDEPIQNHPVVEPPTLTFQATNSDDFGEPGGAIFRSRRTRVPVKISIVGGNGPYSYRLGKNPKEAFEDGAVNVFLSVEDSPLTLTVYDKSKHAFRREITLTQDKLAPRFFMTRERPDIDKFVVKGTLSEPCRWVKVNGQLAQLNGRDFSYELEPNRAYSSIRLEAIDRCGNRAEGQAPYVLIDPKDPESISLDQALAQMTTGTLFLRSGTYKDVIPVINKAIDIVAAKDAILELNEKRTGIAVKKGHLRWEGGQIRFRGQSLKAYLIYVTRGRLTFVNTKFDIQDQGILPPIRLYQPLTKKQTPSQITLKNCTVLVRSKTGQLLSTVGGHCEISSGSIDIGQLAEDGEGPTRKSVIEASYGHHLKLKGVTVQCKQPLLSIFESEAQIEKCRFSNFQRDGLWVKKSFVELTDCQIDNFHAVALRVDNESQAILRRCELRGASAPLGRSFGVMCQRRSRVQLFDSKVTRCTGPALFASGQSYFELVDCKLSTSNTDIARIDSASTLLAGRTEMAAEESGRIVLSRKSAALFEECQFSGKITFSGSQAVRSHFIGCPDYVKLTMRLDASSRALQRFEEAGVRQSFWKSRSVRGSPDFQELGEVFADMNAVFLTEGYTPTIHLVLEPGLYQWPAEMPRVDLWIEGKGGPGEVILIVKRPIELKRYHLTLKKLTLRNGAGTSLESPCIKVSPRGRLRIDDCRLESKGGAHIEVEGWADDQVRPVLRSRVELNNSTLQGSSAGAIAASACFLELNNCTIEEGNVWPGVRKSSIQLGERSYLRMKGGRIKNHGRWALSSIHSSFELIEVRVQSSTGKGLEMLSSIGLEKKCQVSLRDEQYSLKDSFLKRILLAEK